MLYGNKQIRHKGFLFSNLACTPEQFLPWEHLINLSSFHLSQSGTVLSLFLVIANTEKKKEKAVLHKIMGE